MNNIKKLLTFLHWYTKCMFPQLIFLHFVFNCNFLSHNFTILYLAIFIFSELHSSAFFSILTFYFSQIGLFSCNYKFISRKHCIFTNCEFISYKLIYKLTILGNKVAILKINYFILVYISHFRLCN